MLAGVQREQASSLGQFIFETRRARSWSLRKAASAIGVSHTRLDEFEKATDWHHGHAIRPPYDVVVRMARVYELPVHELLGRAGYCQLCDMEPEEAELLTAFRRMDAPTRQALLAHVRDQVADEAT